MISNSSHGTKTVGKVVRRPNTTIRSLPRDLLVDVLARVASSSFVHLFNAKLCCKDFLEATEDEYIFQHISMDKIPIVHWLRPRERMISFQTHCFHKGNPEALFRQGMIEYMSLVRVESGLEHLKRATEKGHLAATYVYGMILLTQGDQSSRQGLTLLNSIRHSRSKDWKLQDCRDKIRLVLAQMWINNSISLQGVKLRCRERDHTIRDRRTSFDEDKEIPSCDSCMWYQELVEFCRIVNGRPIF